MRWLLLFVACAPVAYVKPPDVLLREASLLSPEDACALLTEALASGNYSAQIRTADTMSTLNHEYQIGNARETACRGAEKRAKKAATLEEEKDLTVLRMVAWSAGEDEVLRKRATTLLLQRLDAASPDALEALAAMVPPAAPWPQWYVETGVEAAIEAKLRGPEDLDAAQTAAGRLMDALVAQKDVSEREAEFCATVKPLTPAQREELTRRLRSSVLDRCRER